MVESVEGTSLPEGSVEAGRETRLDFLASHGGPFFELQRRLKLLHESSLRTGTRTIFFVSIAWGIPLLLTLPTLLSAEPTLGSYLADPSPWARFAIAIAAFVATEQAVESGLQRKLGQFTKAPLIAPDSLGKAALAVSNALKQRNSRTAELVCFLLAAISAFAASTTFSHVPTTTWAAYVGGDHHTLTAAGWWCVLVSIPLFVFLFLRSVWRHLIWARLLRSIAALELRLVATHPDGKGGLAFVGEYPNAYVLFVFGVSCAIAAAAANHTMQGGLTVTTLTTIMACWLLIVLAFFSYPLFAFFKPLSEMKDKSLGTLSACATVQQRAAERKLIGRNIIASDPQEAQIPLESGDLVKQYTQTRKLSTIVINHTTMLPVAVAALAPFAVAGATELPYKEVFSVLKKLLLV